MSMIQVIDGYRMNGGHVIPKGYYETDAPELMGIAPYLLENGHARYAEPPAAAAPQPGELVAQSLEGYDGDVIHVKQGYRVAEGKIVAVGLYQAGDPALYGKDSYLVENGYATRIVQSVSSKSDELDETEAEPVIDDINDKAFDDEPAKFADLSEGEALTAPTLPPLWETMTVDELKAAAEAEGLTVPSRATKAKLIELLSGGF